MKPINKEQEQYIANIKGMCEAIEESLKEGKTPQEIAEMFNATYQWENDEEYLYYNIDFDNFGITLVSDPDKPDEWYWENGDEIWLFEAKDWAYWKQL